MSTLPQSSSSTFCFKNDDSLLSWEHVTFLSLSTCPLPATECCFSRSPTEQSVKILKENATLGSIHRSLVTFSWDTYSFSSQGKDSLDNQLTHFFSTLPSQLLFGGWKDNKNNFTEKTKDYSLIMFPSHSSFLPILSFANFFLNIKKQKEEKAAENGNR